MALSWIDSALAVSCPANSEDINDSDKDGLLTTAVATSDCYCKIGFAPDGSGACGACTNAGTTLLTRLAVTSTSAPAGCGGIAPGYYGTALAADTGDATAGTGCDTVFTVVTLAHTSTTTAAGATTTSAACKTAPGYVISTADATTAANVRVTAVVANKYAVGGSDLTTTTATEAGTACPTGSDTATATGSDSLSDCLVTNGYYLSAVDATNGGTLTKVPAGKALSAGTSVTAGSVDTPEECPAGKFSTEGAATCVSCPSGSSSPAGSTSASACICDKGTYLATKAVYDATTHAFTTAGVCTSINAAHDESMYPVSVAITATVQTFADKRGTACAAGYYGTSTDFAGAGCTACPSNTESPAGTTALSGCTVKAGYYLSAPHGTAGNAGTVAVIPAGKALATGGTSVTARTADSPTTCPVNTYSLQGAAACSACPEGFNTDSATGVTTRETCQKTVTWGTLGTQDTFATASPTVLFACPVGSVADVAPRAGVASYCKYAAANYYGTTSTSAAHIASATACPEGSESTPPSTTDADCKVKAGYYLEDGDATATNAVIVQTPAGYYSTGGQPVTDTAGDYINIAGDEPDAEESDALNLYACPANSNSPAGSTSLSACVCDSGYTANGLGACAASTPTASTPTADSAGAAMPIAAAVAAMAMPLLI